MELSRSGISNFFKNTKSVLIVLTCLAYTAMFFSIALGNVLLGALLLFCLINTRPKEFVQSIKENVLPKLVITLYILLLIGLLYTSNYKTGFFILEKKLALLFVPLIALPLYRKHKVSGGSLFELLGYITIGSSILLLAIATYRTLLLKDHLAFYFETFTKPLIHYVYYAMYFAIGTLCLLDSLFDKLIRRKYGAAILGILFIYSLSFLILVASKTGILAFTLTSVFLLYKRLYSKKLFAVSVLTLMISASIVLYFNETTRNRFTELSQNLSLLTREQLGDWNEEVVTGLNMRLLFWKISVKHIWNDNMTLQGTGTGDAQDYLDALYTDPKYNRRGYVGWDTHNEWVFTFVQNGILGFAVLAAIYLIYGRRAFLHKDMKLLIFLSVTFAFSMSESILESNKGIVYVALFFTLFSSANPGDIEVTQTDKFLIKNDLSSK
ncbi:MAG: O-antigen ligase family protein [Cytophagales bacterium]|nr:O-antigen ligase family protein [Cytophagales bacterium]